MHNIIPGLCTNLTIYTFKRQKKKNERKIKGEKIINLKRETIHNEQANVQNSFKFLEKFILFQEITN